MNGSLQGLIVCRHFLEDPVLGAIAALETGQPASGAKQHIAATLIERAEKLGLKGNLLSSYILYLLADGQMESAAAIERAGRAGAGLIAGMAIDMAILWPYLTRPASVFLDLALLDAYEPSLPRTYDHVEVLTATLKNCTSATAAASALAAHYAAYGRGQLARFQAFRLDEAGELQGIRDFPDLSWDDLIGYAAQKERLLENTRAFVQGGRTNNALLTGARGTGKSTAVKALVSLYHRQGLRLIQIGQQQLPYLPDLLEKLAAIRSKRFILFLDDLSFDENEKEYKYVKSAIDGGVTPQPDNVLIYATSNRRHLLKETWDDRHDEMNEVHRADSVNESISLSDRFGLILHYAAPTQDEYLAIIKHELQKAGICLDGETLRREGVRWEMEHSGRNGRIAHQFVTAYVAQKSLFHK